MRICLTVLAFSLLLIRCGGDDATYTVEVIDGVRHVHNFPLEPDREAQIGLRYVRTLGEHVTDRDEYLFYRPNDITIDGEGRIYVLDSGNYRVLKYDPGLNFLNSFGRQGQGPGELSSPFCLKIGNDNQIYFGDTGRGGIVVFDREGREVEFIRLYEQEPGAGMTFLQNRIRRFALTEQGQIVMPLERDAGIAGLFAPDGRLLQRIGISREYGNPFMDITGNQTHLTRDNAGNFYFAYSHRNLIEHYTPGGVLLMRISRQLDFEETGEYTMREQIATTYDQSKNAVRSMLLPIPYMNYFSGSIATDARDRIWVLGAYRQSLKEDGERYEL
ncbi:hypothetical protein ACFL6I_23020 [candidate division KSB1 bacterium]